MEHLWLLGRGVLAVGLAVALLLVAQRRLRASGHDDAPTDIGLD